MHINFYDLHIMRKFYFLLLLTVTTNIYGMEVPSCRVRIGAYDHHQGLEPSQRPKELKAEIQNSFIRIKNSGQGEWRYNGSEFMAVGSIDVDSLWNLLLIQPPKRKRIFISLILAPVVLIQA